VAGVVTYVILHNAIGLTPTKAGAVAGAALTAVLLRGMLFEGLPRSGDHPARERLIMLGTVALASGTLRRPHRNRAPGTLDDRDTRRVGHLRRPQRHRPRRDPPRRHRPAMATRPCTGGWPITITGMLNRLQLPSQHHSRQRARTTQKRSSICSSRVPSSTTRVQSSPGPTRAEAWSDREFIRKHNHLKIDAIQQQGDLTVVTA
jgi:hypothetical protein